MRSFFTCATLASLAMVLFLTGGCAHMAAHPAQGPVASKAAPAASASPDGLYAARRQFRQTHRDAAQEVDPRLALEYAYEYAIEYGITCTLEDILQSPLAKVKSDPVKCGLKSSLSDALEWGLRYMLEDAPKDAPSEALEYARTQALDSAHGRIIEAVLDDSLSKLEADDATKADVKAALVKALNEGIDESFKMAFETVIAGGPQEEVPDGMFAWPVNHPSQYISSGFGFRGRTRGGAGHLHTGVDIVVPMGTPITAASSGTVSFASPTGNGYGLMVKVDHGDGLETWYAHLSAFKVRAGQQVTMGQQIGCAGQTGNASTSHLHYEVHRDGKPVDPEPYLP